MGDWIEWQGGECPVDPETIVNVKLRFKDTVPEKPKPAGRYYWHHMGAGNDYSGGDIIAYREVQP